MLPRFGFNIDFSAPLPWARSTQQWWNELIDISKELEALGYDHIWASEHHFTDDSFGTSPLQILAALSQVTSRIRLGTYVLLLPLHNALRVAEEAASVDILSNGRLELGMGLGYRQIEMEGMGVPRNQRRGLHEEGIAVIREAWSSDKATFHGRHYTFDNLNVTPKPVQQPHPPIWLAARAEEPARRAGRLRANLHLLGGRTIRAAYEEELRKQGCDPADFRVSIFKPIFVARDPEAALNRYRDQFAYFTLRHGSWVGRDQDIAFDREIRRTWTDTSDPLRGMSYMYGTPEDCLQQLRDLYGRKPFTDLISPLTAPFEAEGILESARLFAREVMEPFRSELSQQRIAGAVPGGE
jgi:alkanesulfonate monooxygenase SsuD/methylene tetrahydromethanopterin reductase-like flavin-dependent oxidoreductase (luciferase family)